ncbi:hypothetical protein T11_10705 [Trichinella zimbabwensis]|uniref:Uncharacterized protein n=1 Tax=Trichinella zimbabwensis TaxID=268475 RepID=A0A0V1I3J3_9BILA|nr:hypothetical protein T11_10705 [Trichinella zimbabwensis]
MAQLLDNPRFKRATLVTVQVVRRAKVRNYFSHCFSFHVSERKCGCPPGEVVRQDQNVSVHKRDPFKWSQDVHTDSLQRITCGHGLHKCATVFGWAFPRRTLRARAAL